MQASSPSTISNNKMKFRKSVKVTLTLLQATT
jgi:hypothetical protein